jgi:predicted NUDIX family NTP pyrophosphohydrolase
VKVSAGLLLYRRSAGNIEVLLVHPGGPFFAKRDAGFWTIPKGEAEPGEDLFERAVIEFREELGVMPHPTHCMELGSVKQKGGKVVHAWACEGDFTGPPRSNSFEIEWPPHSGKTKEFPEIDKAEWFSLVAASKKIIPAQVEFLELLASKV